jgi:hypothetical protein
MSSTSTTSTTSTTDAELGFIFSNAEKLLRTAIKYADISTAQTGNLPSEIDHDSWVILANKVHSINNKIGTFIGATDSSLTNGEQIRAESKVIEIIKGVIKKGIDSGGDGREIDDDYFDKLFNIVSVELVAKKTEGDSLDVAKAIQKAFEKAIKKEDFKKEDLNDAYRDSEAQIFSRGTKVLVGKKLNLADSTASSSSSEKSQALIYFRPFTSETRAPKETTSGLLSGCLKFDDGDDNNNDIRETKGSFISGYWVVLNKYTVQLNTSIGGKKKTIILKSNESVPSKNEFSLFSFSTDISDANETRLAQLKPTLDSKAIPSSNTQCEAFNIPEVSSN